MNKLIEWLLQSTSDEVTYLQVIIVSILICVVVACILSDIASISRLLSKDGDDIANN